MVVLDEDFGTGLTLVEGNGGVRSSPVSVPEHAPRDWRSQCERARARAREFETRKAALAVQPAKLRAIRKALEAELAGLRAVRKTEFFIRVTPFAYSGVSGRSFRRHPAT